jgi:hypothetical protein
MTERPLHTLHDDELVAVLRDLEPAIAWPVTDRLPDGSDLATTIRARIERMPAELQNHGAVSRWANARPGWWRRWRQGWSLARPARRALILALVAVLVVAAIAGAVGLGLPGLHIILGEVPRSVPPSLAPTLVPGHSPTPEGLGASLGLGEALDSTNPADLDARAGFPVRLPADPRLGPPQAVYVDRARGGQVTLLWATDVDLPATLEPAVGLLLSEFEGTINEGYFTKVIGATTTLERVRVSGKLGYWLSGDPHFFSWQGPNGLVDDPRRWIGDVLVWADGPITYRLETSLGHDEAIRIAESLR